MQLGCIGIVIGLALTLGGGQGLYTAYSSGEQKTVSYAELVRSDSSVGWVRVKGASWGLQDEVFFFPDSLMSSSDIYIAATPDKPTDDKVHLLVHIFDPELSNELAALDKLPDEQLVVRLEKAGALFTTRHPIDGLLEFGMEANDKHLDAVSAALGERLAPDYKVVKLGEKPPSPWFSFAMFVLGLAILAVALVGTFAQSSKEEKA